MLLIDRMAQNLLGPAYAEYYILFNLAVILNIVLDIGIQNFSNTAVASDNQFFKLNFKNIVIAKSILSIIYLIAVFGVGRLSGDAGLLLLIVASNQILTSFVLYFRTNINGLHYYALDSLLSVSDKFFGILFCIGLYYAFVIDIKWFAAAQLIATGISFLIALSLNLKYFFKIKVTGTMQAINLLGLFKKSLPFALLFALMGLYTRADVLMMKWLLEDALYHCGIYAQSFRLLDASAMFAMLFSGLLLPMYAKLLSTKDDVRPLTNLAATVLLLVSITVATASALFSEDILDRLYRFKDIEQLRQSSEVFTNIMLAFIPMSLTFVFSTLLTAGRDLKFLNVFAISALACNVILNLILIPRYGSYGASISSLTTQSLFALLCIARCFNLHAFKLRFNEIFKFTAFIIALIGGYFLVKSIDEILLTLAIYGVLAVFLAFGLKILNHRQLLLIFKR